MQSFTPVAFRSLLLILTLWGAAVISSASAQHTNRSGEDSTIFVSHTVFLPRESMASGQQNWCIETADLNGDAQPDLLVGSKLDGQVHLHLGQGNGRFRKAGSFPARKYNRALALSDFDGDGDLDLVTVTMKGEVVIMQQAPGLRFQTTQVIQLRGILQDVEALDVDRDGDQDLLVAATSQDELVWFRNDGQGRFTQEAAIRVGNEPRSLAIGDLNGDAVPDVVVGCDDGFLYTFYGDNDGLARANRFHSTSANWALAIADLDGDGRNDIAAASYLDKWLVVHHNAGDGEFPIRQRVLSGDHNFGLVACDFDLDGDLDLATCSTLDEAIGFHLNDGTGRFSARHNIQSGAWNAGLCVADVDADGDPDLAVASINDHMIHIHRNVTLDITPEPDKDHPCLTVLVYESETNRLLSEVPVTLKRERDGRSIGTELSDNEGQVEYCRMRPGSYQLSARAPGFVPGELSFEMPDADFQQEIYLTKPKATFIFGLVTDAVSRERIDRAQIVLTDESGMVLDTLWSDLRGKYRRAIDLGAYRLLASAEGYEPLELATTIIEADMSGGKRVDIALTPIPTDACLAGVVYDEETGDIVPAAIIAIRDSAGAPVRKIRAGEQGRYRVCLPFGGYQFSTKATGYFFKLDEVTITEPAPESENTYDIFLQPLKEDAHFVLQHIYFDVDKATLRPESVEELARVLEVLQDNPSLVVSIEGHTDSDASDSYNLQLSDRRAAAVVNYLIDAGIQATRLESQGFGEREPVAPNDTPENKQLNRRTEFRVIRY